MSITLLDVLEALATIAGSAWGAAAIVKRLLKGPLGEALKAALTEAVTVLVQEKLGALVQEKLEAERPKLLEKLREQMRELVRQETDALRERMARLEGLVEGLLGGQATHNPDRQTAEGSPRG